MVRVGIGTILVVLGGDEEREIVVNKLKSLNILEINDSRHRLTRGDIVRSHGVVVCLTLG